MRSKTSRQRVIDIPVTAPPDANPPIASTASLTGPAIPTLPAPQNLTVASNTVYQSAVTPSALIGLSWNAPVGVSVTGYVVQSATDSGFAAGLTTNQVAGTDTSARLILPTGQLTYFRVAAVFGQIQGAWSSTASATTASDTTAPGVPTSPAAAFQGAGDLQITWVNPTSSPNFRDVEVNIYADSGFTTLLYQAYHSSGLVTWTATQNRQAGSGTPDPTLYVRLRSRSWSGVFSTYVSPGTQPTKAVPSTPGSVTQSWNGDAGTAGADLAISWAAASGAAFYRLTIDGVARDLYATRSTYTLDTNRAEHSGTPDPSLSYSLVAVDALDQVSTAASGTATNAAPATPAAATVVAFFSALSISVSTALPADGVAYRFRLIQTSPSAGDVTWDSPSQLHTREVSASATYQVGLRIIDVFGQLSSETLSSTVVADALTLADLRATAIYSDQLATAPATLLAALADDNRASGGISYASNASWVRWIRFERPITDRYRTITLSMAPASGTANWYLRTSNDGSTWSYYSGPVTSSRILTSVANEAAAQSAAVSTATLGNSSASRVDLPAIVQARYVEVWLRNTAASTRVDEFYPRRLVQSDDIEAESIRAINIAAATITADRLSVSQLSAIAADLGTITAGTVTGATIQTATSGARVELTSANGLRSFDSGGTVQTQIRTSDGAIVAGGGNVLVNANGISVITNNTWALANSYRILDASGSLNYGGMGGIRPIPNSAGITLRVDSSLSGLDNAYAYLEAICASGDTARATVRANITGGGESGELYIETTSSASLAYADVDVMRIRGDVAIQSAGAAPTATLDVYRGTLSNGAALIRGTNYHCYFNYSTAEETYIRGGKAGAPVYLNDSHNGPILMGNGGGATTIGAGGGAATINSGGGDVTISNHTSSQIGIGTSPVSNHKVTINGDTATAANYAIVVRNSSSSNLFYAENNGGLWANVAWTISDEREKHNIRDFDERDLAGLLQLRIRRYARTISGDDETGLIAQELAQVYPTLVREGLDGTLGYRQGDLVTMLLAGYQQLSRRIAAIERRG